MGKKKLKNPYTFRSDPIRITALDIESTIALAEFRRRKETREALAQNDEIRREMSRRDDHLETWMWGLFAIVLHRRYKFRANTLSKIMYEVQQLHNELWDEYEDHDMISDVIRKMAYEETGVDIDE